MGNVPRISHRQRIRSVVGVLSILAALCFWLGVRVARPLPRDRRPGAGTEVSEVASARTQSSYRDPAFLLASHEKEVVSLASSVPKAIAHLEGKVHSGA